MSFYHTLYFYFFLIQFYETTRAIKLVTLSPFLRVTQQITLAIPRRVNPFNYRCASIMLSHRRCYRASLVLQGKNELVVKQLIKEAPEFTERAIGEIGGQAMASMHRNKVVAHHIAKFPDVVDKYAHKAATGELTTAKAATYCWQEIKQQVPEREVEVTSQTITKPVSLTYTTQPAVADTMNHQCARINSGFLRRNLGIGTTLFGKNAVEFNQKIDRFLISLSKQAEEDGQREEYIDQCVVEASPESMVAIKAENARPYEVITTNNVKFKLGDNYIIFIPADGSKDHPDGKLIINGKLVDADLKLVLPTAISKKLTGSGQFVSVFTHITELTFIENIIQRLAAKQPSSHKLMDLSMSRKSIVQHGKEAEALWEEWIQNLREMYPNIIFVDDSNFTPPVISDSAIMANRDVNDSNSYRDIVDTMYISLLEDKSDTPVVPFSMSYRLFTNTKVDLTEARKQMLALMEKRGGGCFDPGT